MRKYMALGMIALLSLTLALALVSCQPKAEETPAATETTTPSDQSMMSDTSMSMPDSEGAMMSDTTAH